MVVGRAANLRCGRKTVVSQSYFWLICGSSDSTWQSVSAIDPKPMSTTDGYQVVRPNDGIRIKTTFPKNRACLPAIICRVLTLSFPLHGDFLPRDDESCSQRSLIISRSKRGMRIVCFHNE